jgi:group I intron endonuclease
MIYLITNIKNNKTYVGKTKGSIDKRWVRHKSSARNGSQTHLHRAMVKDGFENFTISLLSEGYDQEERYYISKLNPEYNMTQGGDGGDTSSSPNYVNSMSKRRSYKGTNNPNYGKHGKNSPNYGKKRTEQQKQNIKDSEYLKSKRRPVVIQGNYYESVMAAARAHDRSEKWVRLHDELRRSSLDRAV